MSLMLASLTHLRPGPSGVGDSNVCVRRCVGQSQSSFVLGLELITIAQVQAWRTQRARLPLPARPLVHKRKGSFLAVESRMRP
jgi:hypothetical protein